VAVGCWRVGLGGRWRPRGRPGCGKARRLGAGAAAVGSRGGVCGGRRGVRDYRRLTGCCGSLDPAGSVPGGEAVLPQDAHHRVPLFRSDWEAAAVCSIIPAQARTVVLEDGALCPLAYSVDCGPHAAMACCAVVGQVIGIASAGGLWFVNRAIRIDR